MSKKRRTKRNQPRSGAVKPAAVVDLSTRRAALAAIADAGRPSPELGRRTPQPTINRYSRTSFGDLSFDRVNAILRDAEQGDTTELVDLWLRMVKTDAHLASVRESRISPVYSARWEVSPADVDETKQAAASLAAKGCEEALRGIDNIERTFAALLDATFTGFAVAEIFWKRGTLLGRPAWVPAWLEPIHGRRFRFSDDYEIGLYDDGFAKTLVEAEGWEPTMLQARGGGVVRLPAGKYIVHQPISINDYPTATGLVHSLVRWWWVKQTVTRLWLTGAEVFAQPRFKAHLPDNATANVLDDLLTGLEKLASDGVVITRGETEIDVIAGQGHGVTDAWSSLFEAMDAAMTKAVLGSTLNVEVGDTGGNRSLGESQADMTIRPRQEQDAAQMWSSIRRDLFKYTIAFNPEIFGMGVPMPVGRSVMSEDPVEVDQLAVDSGAVEMDELRSSRGLTPWGGERGAKIVVPLAKSTPAFSAMSTAAEVAAPDPFALSRRPWDEAAAMARALTSMAATVTSTPSPTTLSESKPSES